MDITSLCTGPAPSANESAAVAEFFRATNAGELGRLAALFAEDAQVNDQLRNFWGREDVTSWLDREIIGEKVELRAIGVKKHYDVVIVNAEIRGDFQKPQLAQPMFVDLLFTVVGSRIVRLLILLARNDAPEPEIRRPV